MLGGTARSALLATGLGVAAMVVAMALMTGYRSDLQAKLIRGNAAVVVYPLGGERGQIDDRTLSILRGVSGARRVGRVVYGQGSLASDGGLERSKDLDRAGRLSEASEEVVFRGVDAEAGQFSATAAQLAPNTDGLPGVVLGRRLAEKLGVAAGDPIRAVALGLGEGRPRFRYQSLEVRGTFETGFAEFDQTWAVLARPVVETLLGSDAATDLLELELVDPEQAPAVAQELEEKLGEGFLVTDWRALNRELFSALALQQAALFVVLGLIVLVSTFHVASTLVVLVRERMRDIGALAALGLSPRKLRRVFLAYSALLGLVGTAAGAGFGVAISWLLTTFRLIRFEPEIAAIYFIDFVPFRVVPRDLFAVITFALAVNLLASWVPAWRAGRLDPSAALRYE